MKDWTVQELVARTKDKIIGQDEYVERLATVLWLHSVRLKYEEMTGESLDNKVNLLVIGESGTGKTATIQSMLQILDIKNYVLENASELRGAGWKGKNLDSVVKDIIIKCDYTNNKSWLYDVEHSIIILDEFDKLFGHKSVQEPSFFPINDLLRFIEGSDVNMTVQDVNYTINTKNMLFICTGAFDGLDEIIEKRLHKKIVGFNKQNTQDVQDKQDTEGNILEHLETQDLIEYGLNEQLLGRMQLVAYTNKLKIKDYKNIILHSKLCMSYTLDKLLYKTNNVHITITEQAAEKMATEASKSSLNVRYINNTIIKMFSDEISKIDTLETFVDTLELDVNTDNTYCINKVCNAE